MTNEYSLDSTTLKQRIIAMPEDRILFRSDYPEYHTEFVGSILSELTAEGILVKIAQGIYAKPRKSRFGVVLPSVDKIVQAIATRDNAEVLPSGMTALNVLGLSCARPRGRFSTSQNRCPAASRCPWKARSPAAPWRRQGRQDTGGACWSRSTSGSARRW